MGTFRFLQRFLPLGGSLWVYLSSENLQLSQITCVATCGLDGKVTCELHDRELGSRWHGVDCWTERPWLQRVSRSHREHNLWPSPNQHLSPNPDFCHGEDSRSVS